MDRYGVGMIADLVRRLVDQTKAKVPTYDSRKFEIASLSVRIRAAGALPGPTFLYEGEPSPDPCVIAVSDLVHGWDLDALVRMPSPARVLSCLGIAASHGLLGDELRALEAKWWMLDRMDGHELPDNLLDAFTVAWLAGEQRFALVDLLQYFLRSQEGKEWLASTPAIVLDEPLKVLKAKRAAIPLPLVEDVATA